MLCLVVPVILALILPEILRNILSFGSIQAIQLQSIATSCKNAKIRCVLPMIVTFLCIAELLVIVSYHANTIWIQRARRLHGANYEKTVETESLFLYNTNVLDEERRIKDE